MKMIVNPGLNYILGMSQEENEARWKQIRENNEEYLMIDETHPNYFLLVNMEAIIDKMNAHLDIKPVTKHKSNKPLLTKCKKCDNPRYIAPSGYRYSYCLPCHNAQDKRRKNT